MLKGGILNPQMAQVLAELGHTDKLVISDAGLPIPLDMERIDLAWKPDNPRFIDVLEEVLKYSVVEKAILAKEIKEHNPQIHAQILKLIPEEIIEYVPHTLFKEMTHNAKAVIRSGEFSPYPNIILVSGCAY